MEQQEQQSNGEQYSGGGSGSASSSEVQEEGGNFEESPPLPFPQPRFPRSPLFPQRNVEYTVNSPHSELLPVTENDGSPVIRNDYWSGVIVVLTFWLFAAMTLIFGVYAPEDARLGPNSSILINPNHLFVESIKVEELDRGKGLMLYGFHKNPPLDDMTTWSDNHKVTLPANAHKEWKFVLNEGSQINISYSMNSQRSSSLVLVIAEVIAGNEGLDAWLENPSYPDSTLSWNIIQGNGSLQKEVSKSSSYFIAVGNLNSELVEVQLKIGIKALLYNTTGAYYQCAPMQGLCNLKLCFLSECAALLTSPGQKSVVANADWRVKISYEPRWITYIVGTGGMTLLVLLMNHVLNHLQSTDQDRRRDRVGVMGSERTPLLSQKDDDLSSWGSSDVSVSEEEEYLDGVQAGGVQDGKPIKDSEYGNNIRRLCAICFDAPRDCFFLPCGHCVACFGCATRIAESSGTCPICRRHTKKVRKIYTV